MLQPWRFEFEYARAWCELDFLVYGIDRPDVIERRMGPKGRSGKVPRPPLRWLPAGLWTNLVHLGVIETGLDWSAQIDTRAGRHPWHRETMESKLENTARTSQVEPFASAETVNAPRSIDVDGVATRFEGLAIGEIWTGTANLGDSDVNMTTVGLQDIPISIRRIMDPAPYLLRTTTT